MPPPQPEQEPQPAPRQEPETCRHSFAFVDALGPNPKDKRQYVEKWACIFCQQTRTLTIDLGKSAAFVDAQEALGLSEVGMFK